MIKISKSSCFEKQKMEKISEVKTAYEPICKYYIPLLSKQEESPSYNYLRAFHNLIITLLSTVSFQPLIILKPRLLIATVWNIK